MGGWVYMLWFGLCILFLTGKSVADYTAVSNAYARLDKLRRVTRGDVDAALDDGIIIGEELYDVQTYIVSNSSPRQWDYELKHDLLLS